MVGMNRMKGPPRSQSNEASSRNRSPLVGTKHIRTPKNKMSVEGAHLGLTVF